MKKIFLALLTLSFFSCQSQDPMNIRMNNNNMKEIVKRVGEESNSEDQKAVASLIVFASVYSSFEENSKDESVDEKVKKMLLGHTFRELLKKYKDEMQTLEEELSSKSSK